MDHIVYMDKKSDELNNLLLGNKDIILRGATGRKLPYGRVSIGDVLYLCNNNGEKQIKGSCIVKNIIFTEKLDKETSEKMVDDIQSRHMLVNPALNRFRGKRYLSIIEIRNVKKLDPFDFDKTNFANMDDWLLVEEINKVL